jgi:hypothetical protein
VAARGTAASLRSPLLPPRPHPTPVPAGPPNPPPSHTYDPAALDKEEGGYAYRYSYNGAGESTVW